MNEGCSRAASETTTLLRLNFVQTLFETSSLCIDRELHSFLKID